jgi:hypothetical protein
MNVLRMRICQEFLQLLRALGDIFRLKRVRYYSWVLKE